MALNLSAVMDGLGVRLATIPGLRVKDYPADSAAPPAAIVSWPTVLEFDSTMGRGIDRCVIPVLVLVGRVSDRASRDALALYLAGTGASSIKAAVEADKSLGGAAQSVRVMGGSPPAEEVMIGAVSYLGARLDVEVYA